jgi:ribosomal protein S18 acetylase RimI-like enzyme
VRVRPLVRGIASSRAGDILALEHDLHWQRWDEAALLSSRPSKWNLSLYAEDAAGAIVGVAVVSDRDHAAHLHRLVVDADWRGRGVGEALVHALGRRAVQHGLRRCTLKVDQENDEARRFYERLGFKTVDAGNDERSVALERGLTR